MGLQPYDVSHIAGMGLPVLCVDTCSILDIMRDPTRDTARVADLAVALDLLVHADTGTSLSVLVCEQVRSEFQEHVDAVHDECERKLRLFCERVSRVDEIAARFGANGTMSTRHLLDHPARARAIAERLLAISEHVPESADIAARAHRRSVAGQAPARKGKGSPGDCAIIETYIEAVSRLRSSGLPSKIVFLSSNTEDYRGTARYLRPELELEFGSLQMEYAPNFGAARNSLGL